MTGLLDSIAALPGGAKWALALACMLLGALLALRTDSVVRGMRRLMLAQLRMVRRGSYARLIRVEGWALLAGGTLLALLLALAGE